MVKNALKFTDRGHIKIKVLYDRAAQTLQVHVCDTGAGISSEELPHLFKQFGKLHRTADQNSDGIGLGLLIVKQIIERSEGSISIWSDGVGCGSTVAFSMPMKNNRAASESLASKNKIPGLATTREAQNIDIAFDRNSDSAQPSVILIEGRSYYEQSLALSNYGNESRSADEICDASSSSDRGLDQSAS